MEEALSKLRADPGRLLASDLSQSSIPAIRKLLISR
jgi:hypothetical protein